MATTLRKPNGEFNGSIGDGRDTVPTPSTTTAAPTTATAAHTAAGLGTAVAVLAPRTRVTLDDISWPDEHTAHLPAGTYWVGDPGYAVDDTSEWLAWLEDSRGDRSEDRTHALVGSTADGQVIVAFSTAYGDGRYYWEPTRPEFADVSTPVDAGLIGIIPDSYLSASAKRDMLHRVEFPETVTCHVDTTNNGHAVCFGDVVIPTVEPDWYCEECQSLAEPGHRLCWPCWDDEYADEDISWCDTCGAQVADGPTDACSGCDPDLSDAA